MFQAAVSSLLKKGVSRAGLLSWWEDRITQWPRVLLYHYIGNQCPPFLADTALRKEVFLGQISALRKRYRFLSWPEYRNALTSPREAKRSLLLTFDDGFRSTWATMSELAADQQIPSVFFVNTRVLDNAYMPWTLQYYFLRSEADGIFLRSLWKSISNGEPLPPALARRRMHDSFSLRAVVEPIEEGLAKFGMTPAELAQRYNLFISSKDISSRSPLIEVGNHSHSHYILSKLSSLELEEDLCSSNAILGRLLGTEPESFAYPFGIPGEHFDQRCQKALRAIGAYPYIFSASDDLFPVRPSSDNIGRICLDKVSATAAVGVAAKVTPRALKNWLLARSSATA